MLEPDEGKLSSPVLGGLEASNGLRLLGTYLASALHDLCGKPIPVRLKGHSADRGTSVPTGNTEAWTLVFRSCMVWFGERRCNRGGLEKVE